MIRGSNAALPAGEKEFAYPSDFPCKAVLVLSRYKLVAVVERRREDFENFPVALLIRLHASEVRHQVGRHGGVVLRKLAEAAPAQAGCLFRVHVEQTEPPKGAVVEMFVNFRWNLP